MELFLVFGLVALGVSVFSNSNDDDPDDGPVEIDTVEEGSEDGDRITGDAQNNGIFGLDGDDTLDGGAGHDVLLGGFGDDDMEGGSGDDSLAGGRGEDTMDGGAGNDLMYGGVGEDSISGDSGNDYLIGGAGGDTLLGGSGNDILEGYEDSNRDDAFQAVDTYDPDTLIGGDGSDLIVMGSGDEAAGGLDEDLFVTGSYVNGTDIPVVEDFYVGEDVLGVVVEEGAPGVISIAEAPGGDAAIVSVDGVEVAQVEDAYGALTLADIEVIEVEYTPVA